MKTVHIELTISELGLLLFTLANTAYWGSLSRAQRAVRLTQKLEKYAN